MSVSIRWTPGRCALRAIPSPSRCSSPSSPTKAAAVRNSPIGSRASRGDAAIALPLSPRRYERQLDEARLARSVVDTFGRLAIILRLREEDVGHEGLRVAVVEREPRRLHLHHDAV